MDLLERPSLFYPVENKRCIYDLFMKYKYEAIYTKNKNPEGGANDLKWFTLNFKNSLQHV